MFQKLREATGCSITECKNALAICDSYEMAYEYLRLKSQAVARYKIENGVKRRWNENDYLEAAKILSQDSSAG